MPLYKVALPTSLHRQFTYESDDHLKLGQFISCPLRGKQSIGMIIDEDKSYKGLVKKISDVLPWCLNPEQLKFLNWISHYTLTPLGMCTKLMLPFAPKEIEKLTKEILKPQSLTFDKLTIRNAFTLTNDQKKAVESIRNKANSFAPFLLDGMTGSGKTEVYFDIISDILEKKQQCLILLPEIALSTQWIKRFEDRFGVSPYLWHSQTTSKNKRHVFNQIYKGEPAIVVGARSSLFLPFQNLKFIVVDEEHESSYKQEEQLIYNARDAAIMRAHFENCPILLASATPSLESYHNAKIGRYETLTLEKRYTSVDLPPITIIDRRQKSKDRRSLYISPPLIKAIQSTIEKQEQSLLFINRRGYAPLTLCNACGHRFECPHCTATLIHHEKTNTLKCHHCNHKENFPDFCPDCGSKDQFIPCGPGVERLYEEAKIIFPDARILVMSSDMFASAKKMKEAIHQILNQEVDIIIGTQIMAKGHHFPNLTLIGVIDADMGLSGMDLRACEKTFQLLFQVAGRAGRSDKQGHIYIQTHNPDHPVIHNLTTYDKKGFLESELEQREAFNMPPFSKLVSITLSSRYKDDLLTACQHLSKTRPIIENLQILGPSIPPIAIVRGLERRRFLVLAEKSLNRQNIIATWVFKTKIPKSVRVSIDIDPLSFL